MAETGKRMSIELDHLADVQVGDPDPPECLGPYSRPSCCTQNAEEPPMSCTRLPDHPGQHIAGTGVAGVGVAAVWPQSGACGDLASAVATCMPTCTRPAGHPGRHSAPCDVHNVRHSRLPDPQENR